MNSLLQCLFNIEELRNFFIQKLKKKEYDEKPICYHFARVIYSLLYSPQEYIYPINFQKIVSEINSLFIKNKAGDATDLFRNLIDAILTEIMPSDNEEEEEIEEDSLDTLITKESLFKDIKNEIKKNEDTNIIYKLMNNYILTTYICPNINKHKNNSEIYNIESDSNITFFLENIIKKRNFNNKSDPITLEECFDYFIKDKMNNEFYCSECKTTIKGKSFDKIFYPPEILIIILNRGHGKKVKNKIIYEPLLDITKYIDKDIFEAKKDLFSPYYRLICSCDHSGQSSSAGHYTACCLYEDSYYYYSDTYFRKLDYYESFGDAYILFYKRTYISDYNDMSKNMQNEIVFNRYKKLTDLEIDNYRKKLYKVFLLVYHYNNNNYSIEIQNKDIFKWIIHIKGKKTLIMDFSKPPEYNLFSTINNKYNKDIKDLNEFTIKINLNDNVITLYEQITLFLNNICKDYIIKRNCNCIII